VIVCGIERKAIFKGDFDKSDFLDRLDHILSASSTPCYAWALMTNHVHLLIRTGMVPLATLMRRLLTGYAVSFNRRHRRHGQLFQNRYKSILFQEDTYLMELTRYIHLNPLRVGMVRSLKALDRYLYTGHATLMGKQVVLWQDTDKILRLFAAKKVAARRKYRDYVEKGVDLGRRPELVGGGLIRSMGGWKQAKKMIKGQQRVKGDERILGDSDFVLNVLNHCNEQLERSYRLSAKGIDVAVLSSYVAGLFDLTPDQLLTPGRYPAVVRARSLFCYWAVRELGVTATDLAKQIGMTQPAISISVKRGEKIAKETEFSLESLIR
jgi:REP element-mobilizing transposase RayT